MVVKEASDTSHYDTILMLDAGLNNQPAAVLSAAVELALALSQKLIEQGIGHQGSVRGRDPAGGTGRAVSSGGTAAGGLLDPFAAACQSGQRSAVVCGPLGSEAI